MSISDTAEVVVATDAVDQSSYVDWPAILAGTVLATAISLVLLAFGSAIGLSLTSAYEGSGISLVAFAIAGALWLLWVQLSGFIAGGYLTGRMRRRRFDATEHESDIRDGSHGLIVWALGVLLGALIAVSGAVSVLSTATTAATTVAAGAAAGAADELASAANPNALLVDRALRPVAGQKQAGVAASSGNLDAATTRAEIGRILMSALSADALDEADKAYLVDTISAEAGVDREQAQQRVDDLWAQAQQIEAEARAAAERARKISMVAAFVAAASLLVSAAGAFFGATLGGNHRDKQVVFAEWSQRR